MKHVDIWTDGASRGNPGPGGYGVVLKYFDKSGALHRKELKEVFMLVDFRHKPTSDDILMYNYLKYYNLKVTVIATKIDKISFGQREKYKNIILKTLDLKEGDNLILFSSVTKDGKKDVYNTVEKYLDFIDD